MSRTGNRNLGYRGVQKKKMSKASQVLVVIIIMMILISAVLGYAIVKKKMGNAIATGVGSALQKIEPAIREVEQTTAQKAEPQRNQVTPVAVPQNPYDDRFTKFNFNTRIQDAEYQEKIANYMSQLNINEAKRNKLAKQIVKVGKQENLDPILMTAVISMVSNFKEGAVSPGGRIGLLQLHPKFVEVLDKDLDFSRYDLNDLSDVVTNLHVGSRIIKQFIDDSERAVDGVAFFYWGSGTQTRKIGLFEEMPKEVVAFADRLQTTVEDVFMAELNDDVVEDNNSALRYPTKEQVIEKLFTKLRINGASAISKLVVKEAEHYSIDPMLMVAIMAVTSKMQVDAKTADGHYGLMYIQAKSGADIALKTKMQWVGEKNLFQAGYNTQMGIRYFAFLKKIFKDDRKALGAYLLDPKTYIAIIKSRKNIPESVTKRIDAILDAQNKFNARLKVPLPPEKESATAELISLEKIQKPATPRYPQNTTAAAKAPVAAIPTPTPHQTHYFKDEIDKIKYIAESYGISGRDARLLAHQIVFTSEKVQVDPSFIAAVIANESNFFANARVKKPVEKIGLFQISVLDGRKIANYSHVSWGGAEGLKDPDYALRLGINYIKTLGKHYKTNKEILGAFYMGYDKYAAARVSGRGVPREVAERVTETLNLYKSWKKDYVVRPALAKKGNVRGR